jgi:hypothetical protein
MSTGFWFNDDGLPLQYGTQKTIPELGGDYLVYGETREVEQLVAFVPYQLTASGITVPAAPTTFSGTGTPGAAGIQSMTTFMPLQQSAPQITTTNSVLQITNSQIFIESVEVETLVAATGGTSFSIGLVTTSPSPTGSSFVQVTPNGGAAGDQIVKAMLIVNIGTAGYKTLFTQPGSTGLLYATASNVAGGGGWVGSAMPLVTNAITPLPTSAWLSTIATGTFTNGLIKVRVRYTVYGNITY